MPRAQFTALAGHQVVVFMWSTEYGTCAECDCPAMFYVPDAYGPGRQLSDIHKRCCVCAANDAATGERVIRIDDQEIP